MSNHRPAIPRLQKNHHRLNERARARKDTLSRQAVAASVSFSARNPTADKTRMTLSISTQHTMTDDFLSDGWRQ